MTSIGRSVVFSGELTSNEDLTVNGQVDGLILVRDATLTIGEDARITGDLRGPRVIVRGTVHGAIVASERIELAPTATVTGDLSANRILVADGAQFNGRVDMGQRTIAAKVAQYKAAQAGV